MTENTAEEALEPATGTSEPEESQEAVEAHDQAPPLSKADREVRLRKRAQEAEAERDHLRELVAGLRKADVERRLVGRLTNPADVWHTAKVEDLLDESGEIDTAKVTAAVDRVRVEHPNWATPRGLPPNPRTPGPIAEVQTPETEDRWRGAFSPKSTR